MYKNVKFIDHNTKVLLNEYEMDVNLLAKKIQVYRGLGNAFNVTMEGELLYAFDPITGQEHIDLFSEQPKQLANKLHLLITLTGNREELDNLFDNGLITEEFYTETLSYLNQLQ